jgi:hypothetical protein
MRGKECVDGRRKGEDCFLSGTVARVVSHDSSGGGRGVANIGDGRDKDIRERSGALLLWGGCARHRAAAPETALAAAGSRGDTRCV